MVVGSTVLTGEDFRSTLPDISFPVLPVGPGRTPATLIFMFYLRCDDPI
jgi:hypothetical protein